MKHLRKLGVLTLLVLTLQGLGFSKGPARPIMAEGELRALFEGLHKKHGLFNSATYNKVPMALGEDTVKPTGTVDLILQGNTRMEGFKIVREEPTRLKINAFQKRPLGLLERLRGVPRPEYTLNFTVEKTGEISYGYGEVQGLGSLLKAGWRSVAVTPIEARVSIRLILEGLMRLVVRK